MYIGLLKYPLFFSDFNETLIFATNFRNYSKFHEDPSSGSRVVSCGRTDGPTDRTELVVAFRNLSNTHKNTCFICTIGNTKMHGQELNCCLYKKWEKGTNMAERIWELRV